MGAGKAKTSRTLQVVRWRLGKCWLGLEAAGVRAASRYYAAEVSALSLNSNLPTIETLLNLAPVGAKNSRQVLIIRGVSADWQLEVAAPVELTGLPAEHIYPLPPLIAACRRMPALHAIALVPDGMILLLNVSMLETACACVDYT